jgi:hypothetical protein
MVHTANFANPNDAAYNRTRVGHCAGWFSSFTVFYAVGLVATAVSIVCAAYYFTGETKDPMNLGE